MASGTDTHTPNPFVVIFGTVAGLFLVAALFIASIASKGKGDDIDARRAQQRRETRQKLEQTEHDALANAGWVDKAKGIVRVPIADAMKSTVAELQNKKAVASSVRVEPALPMPPPYDPNAAEPAPLPLPSAPQGADTMRFEVASVTTPPTTGAGPAPAPPAGSLPPAPTPAPAGSPPVAAPSAPPPAPPPAPPAATPATPVQTPPPAPATPQPPPATAPATPPPVAPPVETSSAPAAPSGAPARPPLITTPQQTSETPQ